MDEKYHYSIREGAVEIFKQKFFRRGSMTVEASIVIPVVLLSITAIIYITMLLYRLSCLQALADRSVEMGAASWSNSAKDIRTGKAWMGSLNRDSLYRRILDTQKNTKLHHLNSLVLSGFERGIAFFEDDRSMNVEMQDYIIYKKLTVKIQCAYKNPLGGLLEIFGLPRRLTLAVESEAVITDPAEFIRNTDFILDLEREMESKYPQLENLGGKTREIIERVREGIQKFFETQ